jgi:hypothetical protein
MQLHRYIQKFYQMRTQLQAISLRIQVSRLNTAEALALTRGRRFVATSR